MENKARVGNKTGSNRDQEDFGGSSKRIMEEKRSEDSRAKRFRVDEKEGEEVGEGDQRHQAYEKDEGKDKKMRSISKEEEHGVLQVI